MTAAITLNQGARWKALISEYIGTIPINHDGPCAAEQISANFSSLRTFDSKAMIAKVGAAARLSHLDASKVARVSPVPTLEVQFMVVARLG